jgi:glutamine amidotransferase
MTEFVIVDCGIGNLRSVQKIFERLGAKAPIADSPDQVRAADAIVLPGVGAFGDAMKKLESDGVADVIRHEATERGKPLLGICLGLQLLGQGSAESPDVPGLGIVPGEVAPLDVAGNRDWMGRKLTLPHIGWNAVTAQSRSQLFDGIETGTDFYFVHGYHLVPAEPEWSTATAEYGGEFVSAIEHANVFAVQFHPEKSQKQGQRLIRNFIMHATQAKAA